MDDLRERDLTNVADEDLSAEERQEVQRRLDTFLGRMQIRLHGKPSTAPKPKAKGVARWSPKTLFRRG